jgi:hypothetical protein
MDSGSSLRYCWNDEFVSHSGFFSILLGDDHGVHALRLSHAGDALSAAPLGCLRRTSFTTDWGF